MNFLYPDFLWAISLIAIPIAIHLFNFRKYKKVYFSDISLLKNINSQTKKQSRLKHLLVLLSRILALICLVLAFSYPYKPLKNNSNFDQKYVGIYVDNSLSMDNKNQNGFIIEQAKEKALEIINQYPTNTRYIYTTNDFDANLQRDISKAEIQDLISKTKATYLQKSYAEIYSKQADLLKNFTKNKDVFWLSDLPKSTTISNLAIDSSVFVHIVPFTNKSNGNLFIDTVWFDTPIRRINKQELINVKLINTHESDLNFRIEALINNNETKGINNGTIDANSSLTIPVPFMIRQAGIKHIALEISDYGDPNLIFDDNYFLTYSINSATNVLHIFEEHDKNYFNSLLNTLENVNYTPCSINSVDYSKIRDQDLIIIENVSEINSGLIASLQEFIEVGKSVVVFPSGTINNSSYNNFYRKYAIQFNGIDTTRKSIANLNYEHPIFNAVFDQVKENINFPVVNENHKVNLLSNSMSNEIISMSNNQPFLIETLEKEGKLYTFTLSTLARSSNFLNHALFVPTILRIVERCQVQNPLSYIIGKHQMVKSKINLSQSSDLSVKKENDDDVFIPGYKKNQQSSVLFFKNTIKNPGNFNVLNKQLAIDGFSFNYSREESAMEFFSIQEFLSLLKENELINFFHVFENIDSNTTLDLTSQTKGILYWKHFIVLTLVFLGLEILFIRIIK